MDFAEHATFGYLLFRPRPETNNPEMWKTALLSLAVALSTAQGMILAGIMSMYQSRAHDETGPRGGRGSDIVELFLW